MLRIIPEIIPALFAGIALAAAEVDWLNYEKPSPVSRRTDLLTMGHNSLVGSPNFKSELKTAETGELQWVVSSDGQKGWAVFRVRLGACSPPERDRDGFHIDPGWRPASGIFRQLPTVKRWILQD